MVKDAELHAEEDRKARELVDARNQGEAMIHSVGKSLKEMGDKIDANDKEKIEQASKELEEAIKGDDLEAIKSKTQSLAEASHKLAEQMYQQEAQADEGATQSEQGSGDDDVVDAEFEEVKDDDKK